VGWRMKLATGIFSRSDGPFRIGLRDETGEKEGMASLRLGGGVMNDEAERTGILEGEQSTGVGEENDKLVRRIGDGGDTPTLTRGGVEKFGGVEERSGRPKLNEAPSSSAALKS